MDFTTLELILMGLVAILWITGGYVLSLHEPLARKGLGKEIVGDPSVSKTIVIYTAWWIVTLLVVFSKEEMNDASK